MTNSPSFHQNIKMLRDKCNKLLNYSEYTSCLLFCAFLNVSISALSQTQLKKIALIGGSYCLRPASLKSQSYWMEKLPIVIENIAISGAGFSTLSQDQNIQTEVFKICENDAIYDIYVFWASTNDFKVSAPIGKATDYTKEDGFDDSKLSTQCGGINYCFKQIRDRNPHAKILFFTSMPIFNVGKIGYSQDETSKRGMIQYVFEQINCCKRWNVPYLNLFIECGIDELNYFNFYEADLRHLNALGYELIREKQLDFLSKHMIGINDITELINAYLIQ